jgi:hypothetical protein
VAGETIPCSAKPGTTNCGVGAGTTRFLAIPGMTLPFSPSHKMAETPLTLALATTPSS